MPDRLTPRGQLETDKRFRTCWAILTGRSFWYEMLRNLVNLRDTLSGKAGTSSKPQDDEDSAKDSSKAGEKSDAEAG